jgi:hypothetical protein
MLYPSFSNGFAVPSFYCAYQELLRDSFYLWSPVGNGDPGTVPFFAAPQEPLLTGKAPEEAQYRIFRIGLTNAGVARNPESY